ncbi:MAG: YkgJ family cysteine cluster protein [Deltaproteobacteria bacterium]|nr:YkgJ family cysteine cluster protein [Deltaproteobacteria bacterium]
MSNKDGTPNDLPQGNSDVEGDNAVNDDGLQEARSSSLTSYFAARAKLDEAIAEKTKLAGDALVCGKGCSQCCVGGLEVLPVEVGAIEVLLEEEGLNSVPLFQNEKCPFLDGDDECSIYDARPFVCRTQGLALRMDDEEQDLVRFSVKETNVAACVLNFTEREPEEDDVLDMGSVQALLTAVNAQFCEEFGYPTTERIALAGVADAILQQLVDQGIVELVPTGEGAES